MLRLVHPPPPAGQGTDPPKRRRYTRAPSLFLSLEEARHLRASIRNIARAYGALSCLAEVMGVHQSVLTSKARPSAALALAVARAGGTTVEAIISGTIPDAGRCTACGSRIATGRTAGGAS